MGTYRNTAAKDYRVTDGTETVTFTAVRAGVTTTATVHYADPHDYTLKELAGLSALGGEFAAGDRQWTLGADQLSGVKPQKGDKITDADGVEWYLIGNATLDSLRVSWVCPSRQAR